MISYAIAYRDGFGNLLRILDNITALEYSRTVNKIGALRLLVPDQWDSRRNLSTYDALSAIDAQIEVWRQVDNEPPRLGGETVWFVRGPGRRLEEKGQRYVEMRAVDATELLKRRFVAPEVGTDGGHGGGSWGGTQTWDDMMKKMVLNNMGSTAQDSARRLPSANFSVADYLSLAATSVNANYRHMNLLQALQSVCERVAGGGVYLAFDIVRLYANHLQFQTFLNWRGADHRFPTGASSPVVIDPEVGAVSNIAEAEDWTEEWNFAKSIGGETELGYFGDSAQDDERIGLSLWNRREMARDFPDAKSHAESLLAAEGLLREGRPRRLFSGQLLQSPAAQYGKHYGFGDIITANYINRQYNVRLDNVTVRFGSGAEEIHVAIKSDEVIN